MMFKDSNGSEQFMGNSHCFYASYVCATTHKGSRIKVWNHDLRLSNETISAHKRLFSYKYEYNDVLEQVLESLIAAGFTIESFNSRNPAFYTIHCKWENDGVSAAKVRAYFDKKTTKQLKTTKKEEN